MDPLKTYRDEIPQAVLAVRVKGHKHSYYELSDGDYLGVATPSQGSDYQLARDNMAPMAQDVITECVRESPELLRELVGLRDCCLIFVIPQPEPLPGAMSLEAAEERSSALFGPFDEPEEEEEVVDPGPEPSEDVGGPPADSSGGSVEGPPDV